jgi:hypothetical protein
VLLFEPLRRRKLENKLCFSFDNVKPPEHSAQPQSLHCEECPMGDINWEKWRRTQQEKTFLRARSIGT